MKIIWYILFFFSFLVHYLWAGWAFLIAKLVLRIENDNIAGVAVLGSWGLMMIICNGCPFSYVHQFIEVKLQKREKVTYTIKDSILYRIAGKVSSLLKKGRSI